MKHAHQNQRLSLIRLAPRSGPEAATISRHAAAKGMSIGRYGIHLPISTALVSQQRDRGRRVTHRVLPLAHDVVGSELQDRAALAGHAEPECDDLQNVVRLDREVSEDGMLVNGSRPIVTETVASGKRSRADQLDRRERLAGAVEGFEDRADRLELGRLRENGDRERVLNQRVDECLR